MATYLVLDVNAALRLVALRDRFDRYHVARTRAELPAMGVVLEGPHPIVGACAMVNPATGHVHAFTFQHGACSQQQTFDELHGSSAEPPPLPPSPRPPVRFSARRSQDTWDSVAEELRVSRY